MKDPFDIIWTCPNCNTENTDNHQDTAFPACSNGCGKRWWDEVLTPEQMKTLNAAWTEQEMRLTARAALA